jgi:UDP-GlcNAc:undecaprenyl-phosphate GlcNAc-1-phosphate transferase
MLELPMYLLPFTISLLLTPLIKRWSTKAGAYAHENARTIHHGKISRIGGVAIYLGFLITMALTVTADDAINGVVLGGSIMFFVGLIDDLIDIKPVVKLFFEVIAACVLIYYGVRVDVLRLPFGIKITFWPITYLFTLVWVCGITNAVNLIDGLDGLCGGLSVIILVTTASVAIIERRVDIVQITLILAASTLGFLVYNSYPASIFMGDCGSLFLGFMISAISLLGFKSSTIITLALPIVLLLLPIIDTLSAILRRTLKGMKFSQADKSHIHHLLMNQFGHPRTVLIMCGLTTLFGMSALLYMINKPVGFLVLVALLIGVELFIEKSAMISEKFHPLMGLWRRIKRKYRKIKKIMAEKSNAKKEQPKE